MSTNADFTLESSSKASTTPIIPQEKGVFAGHGITQKDDGVLAGKSVTLPNPKPADPPSKPLEKTAVSITEPKQIEKVPKCFNSVFPKQAKIESEDFVNKFADLKNHPGTYLAKVNGKFVYTNVKADALTSQQIRKEIENAINQIEIAFEATENPTLKGELKLLAMSLSLGYMEYLLQNEDNDKSLYELSRTLSTKSEKMSEEIDFLEKIQEGDEERAAIRKASPSLTKKRLEELFELLKKYRAVLTDKSIDISQKLAIKGKFMDTMNEINKLNQFNKLSSKTMELFYAHVDPSYGKIESLQHLTSQEAIQSVLTELNHYQDKSKISASIAELSFAQEINKKLSEIQSKEDLPKLAQTNEKIMAKIKALPMPAQGSQSPCVLLPGGYINAEKGGHAVMYQIEREGPDKFKFTIINTGEKAKQHVDKDRTVDIVYTNLSINQLSNCLLKLNEYSTPLLTNSNMDKVYKTIEEHLLLKDPNGVTNEQNGHTHRMQNQGTCSVRCILSWLYSRIGKEEYRQFRPGSMQRVMHTAREEMNKFKDSPFWKLHTFGTSDDKVIQVLSRRLFSEMESKIQKAQSKLTS